MKFKEVPYQKLGRFIAAFGSYKSKTLKTVKFCKKWPNIRLNGPRAREGAIWPPLEEKKLPEGEWRTLRV